MRRWLFGFLENCQSYKKNGLDGDLVGGKAPVPRKRAMSGKTILSPKPLLKKNILSMMRIGTSPKMGMVHLMSFRTFPNFLISAENCSTSGLGNTFVQKPSFPCPKETCSFTSCGSCPYLLKKLNVCLKMGEPPCTPSLSQVVPYCALSKAIEVACPPQTDLRSITVILNLSGCWAKVAAHDYDFGLSVSSPSSKRRRLYKPFPQLQRQ